jgi:hypothetical protein
MEALCAAPRNGGSLFPDDGVPEHIPQPEKGDERILRIIRKNVEILNKFGFGWRVWLLSTDMDILSPNDVFELAEEKGLPETICFALKKLQQHRSLL